MSTAVNNNDQPATDSKNPLSVNSLVATETKRVIVIGSSSCGKTAFMERSTGLPFRLDYQQTLGADMYMKHVPQSIKKRTLSIWCCSGHERYMPLIEQFFDDADAAVIVFDMTSTKSFKDLVLWHNECKRLAPQALIYIIGTKSDDVDSVQIKAADAFKQAKEWDVPFKPVSSKTGANINEFWTELVDMGDMIRYVYLGTQNYEKILSLQNNFVNQFEHNLLLLVQHPPTFTAGRRIKYDESTDNRLQRTGAKVFHTLRGGQWTYHGPGQLMAYAIFNLKHFDSGDNVIRSFVDRIELSVKDFLLHYRIIGTSCATSGVWVDGRKIASIGLHVRRWINCHGVGLNVESQVEPWFEHIIPCGCENSKITSIQSEKQQNNFKIDDEMVSLLANCFGNRFNQRMVQSVL